METEFDKSKIEALCRKHAIKLLVLHGSYAKGIAKKDSDIDIGVLGEGKAFQEKYYEIIKDLGGVFGEKVDPAFLNGAEPMICYHVALAGKPLYEEQKDAFKNFKLQSIARYIDTKKFRDLERLYIKRAVQKAG